MTAPTGSNAYERGLELAEAGQHEAALRCIQEHLRAQPHDAQALNDAGAILHCLGCSEDAIEYLTKARSLQPDSGEILWNLMEAYLAAGLASEASCLVDTMSQMKILNVDVVNRLASRLLDQGKQGEAADVLLKSSELWPEQEILKPIMDIIRSNRPEVGIFHRGPSDGFLAEAFAYIQQRFRTRFFSTLKANGDAGLIQEGGIAWFDGGGKGVIEACRAPRPGKVVVSLRHSDLGEEWIQHVRWENVDILVLIGSSAVEETLQRCVPGIRNRTRVAVIGNGISVDRYCFHVRPKGRHLACVGGLSGNASPGILLQCVQKLHYLDPDYRLFFAGSFQNPIQERYLRHSVETLGLGDVVFFEPCPSDLNAWLNDKHFIVSSGMDETHVEMILAGMAFGLKPVVHDFPGADRILPRGHLFNIAEEFCQQVLADSYDPLAYRRFVEDRYPIRGRLQLINGILRQLETEIEMSKAADACNRARVRNANVAIRAFGEPRPSRPAAANV